MERNRATIILGGAGLGCLAVFLIISGMRQAAVSTSTASQTNSASTAALVDTPNTVPVEAPKQNDDAVYGFATLSKQKMDEALKDPEAAKYKDLHNYRITGDGKTVFVVCGEVNAKNGFGGYDGYRRFMASPIIVVMDGQANADFEDIWSKMCSPSNQMSEATGW